MRVLVCCAVMAFSLLRSLFFLCAVLCVVVSRFVFWFCFFAVFGFVFWFLLVFFKEVYFASASFFGF